MTQPNPPARQGDQTPSSSAVSVSIVVPVYNEASVLRAFHARLRQTLDQLTAETFEIIYIDDGSTDASFARLESLQAQDPSVGIARLSRNFGKESALSAGLDLAKGQAVIVIDARCLSTPEDNLSLDRATGT